jgi:hypothetical protein
VVVAPTHYIQEYRVTSTPTSPETGNQLARLLDRRVEIAEFVNSFQSKGLQTKALDAVIQAFGISAPGRDTRSASAPATPVLTVVEDDTDEKGAATEVAGEASTASPKPKSGARKRRTSKKWDPVRNINFRPDGKQSLKDLAAEKSPHNFPEKNVLAVYWLEETAEIQEIGVGHVLAAYAECEWKPPSDPENSLQVTASQRRWVDTANMKAITVTHSGRSTVLHDMPIAPAKGAKSA